MVVAAARELLERHGGSFTMGMLAQELGVAVSSLYNHVSSRDEVLARISDDVVQGIDTSALAALRETGSASPAQWRAATRRWAVSYRDAFAQRPWVVETLATTPVASAPQTLAMYDVAVGAFVAAGWAPGAALDAIEALEAFLLGSALDEAAPEDIFDPADAAESVPVLAEAHRARPQSSQAARAFELGLDAMLDGLMAHLPNA